MGGPGEASRPALSLAYVPSLVSLATMVASIKGFHDFHYLSHTGVLPVSPFYSQVYLAVHMVPALRGSSEPWTLFRWSRGEGKTLTQLV